MKENRRLAREQDTISKMLLLYCRENHKPEISQLCGDCLALEQYAHQRIDRCPFGALKPTCARCTVHCYQPEKREAIRQVMRYAGPRMLLHHPLLTVLHLMDGLRYKRE